MQCLICDAPLEQFMSFGRMPIANGFLTAAEIPGEYFFELRVGFCPACTMVQLLEQPDRERMFHENYAFFTSSSKAMTAHFQQFAAEVVRERLTGADPFVVEIGSNDGTMLANFASRGIRHLGVEPSANVAQVARDRGIQTTCRFFDEAAARDILAEQGPADAVLAANVMCHIPYLHSIAAGIRLLLKPDGVFAFEDPYLGDIVQKTSYDQIYDEHAFYFSTTSVSRCFARHGLDVVDVQPQDVHGGSMRYVLAHAGRRAPSVAVAAQLERERQQGLSERATYDRLRASIERSRVELLELLRKLKAAGKRVVGYAATSKSTTVTNYCGISPELVEFISDTTPIKQGKLSPGTHIPVRPHADFASRYPDYALLFGWNHAREIMQKEEEFRRAGGKWIVYVPQVQVL